MTMEVYRRGSHFNERHVPMRVSIQKQTRFQFSKPLTQWLVERGRWIEFMFDRETGNVAFHPVAESSPNAYRIYWREGAHQSSASAKVFIQFIGSPPNGSYSVRIDGDLLIINIHERAESSPLADQEGK